MATRLQKMFTRRSGRRGRLASANMSMILYRSGGLLIVYRAAIVAYVVPIKATPPRGSSSTVRLRRRGSRPAGLARHTCRLCRERR